MGSPVVEKTCFKCSATKPLTEFYRHPQMGDGHLGKCKECTKRDVGERYRVAWDDKVAYERERRRRPPGHGAKRDRLHRQRHPDRAAARTAVARALRSGQLQRKPCEECGAVKAQAHHEDYSRPLDVRWMCRACHMIEHGKRPYPEVAPPAHQ